MQEVIFEDLGTRAYKDAWNYQEELLKKNVDSKMRAKSQLSGIASGLQPDLTLPINADTHHHLLLCEHPPVYTLGKSGHPENVLISEAGLKKKGIEYYQTNRGGDITFHGPGQIVGYPILDLEKFYTDIGRYLRNLEEVIILTLQHFGIKGERSPGETGVWIDPTVKGRERKICAMGVRCSRWVTMHGFALNVNTRLDYFDYIVPCGIANKQVTSMEKELGNNPGVPLVKATLKSCFEEVFACRLLNESN